MCRALLIPVCVLLVLGAQPVRAAPPSRPPQAALSLSQATAQALRDSDELVAVRARVQKAQALRRKALATMLPSLTATGTYRLNDQEVTIGDRVVKRRHDFFGGARLDLALFDGRAWPAWRSAGQLLDVAHLALDDARQALRLEVAQAYYAVLAAEEMTTVAVEALAARRQHVAAAQARLDAGRGVILDLERARAAMYRSQRDLLDARQQVSAARDRLAVILAAPLPLTAPVLRPASVLVEALAPARLQEQARRRRLELEMLRQRLEVAERSRTGTWMSLLPRLALTGNLDFSQASFSSPNLVTPSLSVTLTWTLYDGGLRYAQLDEDAATILEARAGLRSRSRAVRAEVRDAIRAIERGGAALRATVSERAASQRAVDAARRAFAMGAASSLDVLDARLNLEQAQASEVREQLTLDLARIRLQRVTGGLRR